MPTNLDFININEGPWNQYKKDRREVEKYIEALMQVIEEKGYKYLPGEKIAELCMDSDDGLMTIIYFKDESGLMSFELHQDGELGKFPENWNVLEEQLAQLFIELRIPDDDLIPYDEMVSSTEYEDTATTLREFYVRKI